MSRKIEMSRATTNLKVDDEVKYTVHDDDRRYRVAYIDLNKGKAVLLSVNYANKYLIIDLYNSYAHDIIDTKTEIE